MKRGIQSLLFIISLFASINFVHAQDEATKNFSLFYEYQKNKDFISALPYGWKVINNDPAPWVKYKLFTRMEEILWYLHDSTKIGEKELKAINDTINYFYDRAIKYEPNSAGYFMVRKAYVNEIWINADPLKVIGMYEDAIAKDPETPEFYIDRLGMLYVANASDGNDYKLKALDIYSKLSEADPNNALWIQKLESIAENIEELVEITKKSWDLDKDNLEKAWKYASTCLRAKDSEKAKEALEFLTVKAPEVVNYWKQLGTVYDKLDNNDGAIKAYKKLIELQPEVRDNYLNLALVYKRMDQLSVARTYLVRAMNADGNWDYPVLVEAQLYEQAARACDFDFMAKCVYLLAVNTYRKVASMDGQFASPAAERVKALQNSIPTKEDYFFRKIKSGDVIKIEGACYSWIGKSVQVP